MAIADILLAAGCTVTRLSVISEVTSQFGKRIASLVNFARRLGELLDKASNLEVFIAHPGEDFKGESMENTERTEEGPVLCAISMGLMSRVEAPVGVLAESERKVVLKATVILESFLDPL